jgi:hypothetical protein
MGTLTFLWQLIATIIVLIAGVFLGDYLGYLLYGGVKQDWIDSTNTKDNEDA